MLGKLHCLTESVLDSLWLNVEQFTHQPLRSVVLELCLNAAPAAGTSGYITNSVIFNRLDKE